MGEQSILLLTGYRHMPSFHTLYTLYEVMCRCKVMCGEYQMTGVLVATKDKQDKKACTIPASCKGY